MIKPKFLSEKAFFYDGFRFVIKIFVIEVDIPSSAIKRHRIVLHMVPLMHQATNSTMRPSHYKFSLCTISMMTPSSIKLSCPSISSTPLP